MKFYQYILIGVVGSIILWGLVSSFLDHHQSDSSVPRPIGDTLHALFMERCSRFHDSCRLNDNKAIMRIAARNYDSAMYFHGKAAAYLEMEIKELHK